MDVYHVLLVILCEFIIFSKSERCKCFDQSDCGLLSWAHVKDVCFNGCTPGWGGLYCDNRITTTTAAPAAPCHCAYSYQCRHFYCSSCQKGWYGNRCDKKTHTTHRDQTSDDSSEEWKIFGFIVAGAVLFLVLCCCCCGGKKKRQTENPTSPQMWRTEASADSQLRNVSLSNLQSQSRTDTDTTIQSNIVSINYVEFDPPPSYESVMLKENGRSETTTVVDNS